MTGTSTTSPLDAVWEVVVITLRYLDKGQPQARTVRIVRSEVEANERAHYVEQAQVTGSDDAITAAESYVLTPERFQERIVGNVEGMATSPLRVKGDEPNTFRILPPGAVIDVSVTVNPDSGSPIIKL
jgi:hypothetical protein